MAAIETVAATRPTRLFSQSMLISAVRCTLTYLVLPFVLPVVGITWRMNSGVGLTIGVIAIAANAISMHRFWSSDHAYRVHASTVNAVMIAGLSVLVVRDMAGALF